MNNGLLLFKRFRGKINIQKPRQPHYDRALVSAVTTPTFNKLPLQRNCYDNELRINALKTKPVNPYDTIIAREAANWFKQSKMIAFFHLNSIQSDDMFKVRVALHKHNIHVKIYGKAVLKQALEGTKFETVLPLFEARNCIAFSPNMEINKMLKAVRRTPQLILLAGIVEDQLLSKNELTELATGPNLMQKQMQLVQLLNSVGGSVVNNLQTHQTQLSNLLDLHADGLSKTNQS